MARVIAGLVGSPGTIYPEGGRPGRGQDSVAALVRLSGRI